MWERGHEDKGKWRKQRGYTHSKTHCNTHCNMHCNTPEVAGHWGVSAIPPLWCGA